MKGVKGPSGGAAKKAMGRQRLANFAAKGGGGDESSHGGADQSHRGGLLNTFDGRLREKVLFIARHSKGVEIEDAAEAAVGRTTCSSTEGY